jgi:hypothetical protein
MNAPDDLGLSPLGHPFVGMSAVSVCGSRQAIREETSMSIETKRTTSLALGVADMAGASKISSAMMGSPSPQPGAEREITDHVTLKYLRAFDASKTAGPDEPSVWLDFSFRFDRGVEASAITDWLIDVLGTKKEQIVLRFDNNKVALETEPLRRVVGDVLRLSL